MKKYMVTIPVAGHLNFEVKANSEEEAIEKALSTEWSLEDIIELDAYEKLIEGNVCHVYEYEASAEEIEDDDIDEDDEE